MLINSVYQQLLITESSKRVFNEVTTDHLPVIRHLAEIDVNEHQCQRLLNALETLTTYVQSSFCYCNEDQIFIKN